MHDLDPIVTGVAQIGGKLKRFVDGQAFCLGDVLRRVRDMQSR